MKVRILPEAEADLARAADFYDAQAGGLGDYFIECLSGEIEALKVHAGVHERQHGFFGRCPNDFRSRSFTKSLTR